MDRGTRAVTEESLGAWLLKVDPRHAPMEEWQSSGFVTVTTRCVRPTYRSRMVREGHPVLLWVSGSDPACPAGIHAHGHATGPVLPGDESGPVLPVRLRATDPVVPRSELLATPDLRDLEVLRMPAGSNPSFLDRNAWVALCEQFPQVNDS